MRPFAYLYPYGRTFILLDGNGVRVRVDPDNVGEKRKWYLAGKWKRDKDPFYVSIPSCWQTWGKVFQNYSGIMWYLKEFDLNPEFFDFNPKENNHIEEIQKLFSRILLDFTASDFETKVWINDIEIGVNKGGYSRFTFDVVNALKWGKNSLVVKVTDQENNSKIPHGKQGGTWYSQISGIWGSYYLEFIKGSVSVEDIYVKTNPIQLSDNFEKDDWKLSIEILLHQSSIDNSESIIIDSTDYVIETKTFSLPEEISNIKHEEELLSYFEQGKLNPIISDSKSFKFIREIEEANGKKGNKKKNGKEKNKERIETKLLRLEYNINMPKLWHPDHPNLYGLLLIIKDKSGNVLDSVSSEFGFRFIETRNSLICLNGKAIILRGVLDQAFHPDTLYNYPLEQGSPDAFIRNELFLLKEMGINLNRKHIKIEDPRYIFWCDHIGLFYWEEMPNFMIPSFYGISLFRKELINMILRDRNHPSIIIWGIFNEEWGIFGIWTGFWNRLIRKLVKSIRSYDNSRFIVDNSGWAHGDGVTDINDYHAYYIIPESYNIWSQKIKSIFKYPDKNFRSHISREKAKKLPIIISEFGCGGLPFIDNLKIPKDIDPDFRPKDRLLPKDGYPDWYLRGSDNQITNKVYSGGIYERYKNLVPPDIFKDHKELEELDQWKEYLNLKYLVEEMRLKRSKDGRQISGYIFTELSDIEWEYNGLLDYRRNKKIFHEYLPQINADTVIIIRFSQYKNEYKHNFDSGSIVVKIFVSNYSDYEGNAQIKWNLKALELNNSAEISLKTYTTEKVQTVSISLDKNELGYNIQTNLEQNGYIKGEFSVELIGNSGNLINKNSEPIIIWDKPPLIKSPFSYAKEKGVILAPMIKKKHIKMVKNGINALIFMDECTEKKIVSMDRMLWNYKSQAMGAIYSFFYPRVIKQLGLRIRPHPHGESWISMFSLLFLNSKVIFPLRDVKMMGWEFQDLIPDHKLNIDEMWYSVILKEFGSIPKYEILSGIVQGWVNQIYATTIKIKLGNSTLIISTLPLLKELEKENGNPLARVILKNLIDDIAVDREISR